MVAANIERSTLGQYLYTAKHKGNTTMKVQKIKNGKREGYILLGNNYERFPEVDAWVRYLLSQDCSPGTVRTYLYNLMPYYEFMCGIGENPLEIYDPENPYHVHQIMMDFSAYLDGRGQFVTAIDDEAPKARTNESYNRIMGAVVRFYEAMKTLDIYTAPFNLTTIIQVSKYDTHHPLAELYFGGKTRKKNLYSRPVVEKPVKYILRDQYTELFFAFKNNRDRLMAALMFECGLRVSEVRGLKWEDLSNLEDNVIHVVFRKDNENGARVKYCEERSVPVPDYVVDMLIEHERELEKHEAADHVSVTHGFVFCGMRRGLDRPLSYSTIYDCFERVSKILEREITPHMLRHGFANDKLGSGFTENEVRVMMGHKHVSTTMRSYINSAALLANPDFKKRLKLSCYAPGGILKA